MGLSDFARRVFRGSDTPEATPQAAPAPGRTFDLMQGRIGIRECAARSSCTVAGRVTSVTSAPAGDPAKLTVTLMDDTDTEMSLVWLGRRRISGVDVGTVLGATGTVSSKRGVLRIVDPSYTIIDGGHA